MARCWVLSSDETECSSPASHALAFPLILLFDVLLLNAQKATTANNGDDKLPDAEAQKRFESSSLSSDETFMLVPQCRLRRHGDDSDDALVDRWNFYQLQHFVLL
jgi:hypothetical protein